MMKNNNTKVAIIGAGKWGFNHIRTAAGILPHENITVCDANPAAREKVSSLSESINFVNDVSDVIENKEINCVIVATPAETHFAITKELLLNGRNVLVEKPITLKAEETDELIEIADNSNLKLMVGHILLYHPAFKKMKEEVNKGRVGKLQYIYSNRLNLGALRTEENILWSFAPHDISMIQDLTNSYPEEIKAHGARFLQHNIEDTTLTYLRYPGNIHAHIYVSWLNPFKEQRLVIVGDEGMMVFEDTLKDEKLKFYSKGFKLVNGKFEKFDDHFEVIPFEGNPPLQAEQEHFFDCVLNDKKPLTDGHHAVKVLKILEEATSELANGNNN